MALKLRFSEFAPYANGQSLLVTPVTAHFLLLDCCEKKDLSNAKVVHTLSNRFGREPFIDASMIRTYALCGSLSDAYRFFTDIPEKTVDTWNAIIFAHANLGETEKALELYRRMDVPSKFASMCILKSCSVSGILDSFQASLIMVQHGIPISKNIILCMLQGCLKTQNIIAGRYIHSLMVMTNLDCNAFLCDHLIRFFAMCDSLQEANQVFAKIQEPTIYSWTAIISAHANLGDGRGSIQHYKQMLRRGVKPNEVLILSIIKACSSLGCLGTLHEGRLIHNQIMEWKLDYNIVIRNTLVDMYAKCMSLEDAKGIFERLRHKDVVSWGAMITGYVKCGFGFAALELYRKMWCLGIVPTKVILVCGLAACSNTGFLIDGHIVHNHVVHCGHESDIHIGTALVDMYAKYGNFKEARNVFDSLPVKNVMTWGAIIGGYAEYGNITSAFLLFEKMQEQSIFPNRVIFLNLMRACSSRKSMIYCKVVHDKIIRSGIVLDVVAGSALVDMYARCERPEVALMVMESLPERNIVSWSAMIGAYARLGMPMAAQSSLTKMQNEGIDPDTVILTSMLAAYSHVGLVEEGSQFHRSLVGTFNIVPNNYNFNCIIDLLCRGGCLDEAKDLITSLPLTLDTTGWETLLTGCHEYCNVTLGKNCFHRFQGDGS